MTITTQTFPGAPDGVNLADAAHVIPDTFAAYIQDGLLDEQGLLDQRGPIRTAPDILAPISSGLLERGTGIVGTYRQDNVFKLGVILASDLSTRLRFLTDNYSASAGDYTFPSIGGFSSTYPIVDAKPALGAGMLIGISDEYGLGAVKRALAYWRGGGKADYSTGTITTTVGTTTVTGAGTSWSANAEPGMFLLQDLGAGNFTLLGVVRTVNSNTSITLEQGALKTTAGVNYKLTSIRGLNPRVATGRITTSGTTVNGGDTKFKDQGIGSGWSLYRARDMKWIGDVSSVASNIQLTLGAAATESMSNERYVLIRASATYSPANPTSLGFLNAVWNGYQFYLNQNSIANNVDQTLRVQFGEQIDFEAVDLTQDNGSFFDIPRAKPGETGRALIGTNNALLVIKEHETYGVFGTDPDNWHPRKLADDGTISTMSAVPYEGGAIWAGSKGIYLYDGVEAKNIVEDRLGQWYERLLADFNPHDYRAWGLIERNHYKLFIESVTPASGITKGSTTSTPTRMTISINLSSGAVTFHTNIDIRGAIVTPSSVGKGTLFVTERDNDGTREVVLSDAANLFADSGVDGFASWGNTAGPDFYLETKKYDLGDPQIKKFFKSLLLWTWVEGGNLLLDIIKGLGSEFSTSATRYTPNSQMTDRRIKFQKRSQFLQFRLYRLETGGDDLSDTTTSGGTGGSDEIHVTKRTMDVTASIKQVKMFLLPVGAGNARAVIYSDNAGSPGTLLAVSADESFTASGSQWYTFTFSSAVPVTSGTTYWIGIHNDSGNIIAWRKTDATSTVAEGFDAFADGSPTTFTPFDTDPGEKLKIHLVYESPSRVRLGPLAIGFKWMRRGKP